MSGGKGIGRDGLWILAIAGLICIVIPAAITVWHNLVGQ